MFDSTTEAQGIKQEWLSRDEFITKRDEFVQENIDLLESEIKAKMEVENEEVARISAEIIARCGFVYQTMVEKSPVEFPCEIAFEPLETDEEGTLGYCDDSWSLDGDKISLKEVANQDLESIKLENISVEVNWNHVVSKVADILSRRADRVQALKDEGYTPQEATDEILQSEQRLFEEESVRMERVTVEEMAHAYYYAAASENPRTLALLVEDRRNQSEDQSFDDYLMENLEHRARIWVREFLRRYYPESMTNVQAKKEKQRIAKLFSQRQRS